MIVVDQYGNSNVAGDDRHFIRTVIKQPSTNQCNIREGPFGGLSRLYLPMLVGIIVTLNIPLQHPCDAQQPCMRALDTCGPQGCARKRVFVDTLGEIAYHILSI